MQRIPENTAGLRMMLIRKRLGLSQSEVAKAADIPFHAYQRMERGYLIRKRYDFMERVKEVMGVDFDDPELVAVVERLRPEGCQQPAVDDNQLSLFGNV